MCSASLCDGLSRRVFYTLGVICYIYLLILLMLTCDFAKEESTGVPHFKHRSQFDPESRSALQCTSLINTKFYALIISALLTYLKKFETVSEGLKRLGKESNMNTNVKKKKTGFNSF